MPIELDKPRSGAIPVLKRSRIGEQFNGGLIRFDQRDFTDGDGNKVQKTERDGTLAFHKNRDGSPKLGPDGKPLPKWKQELVVHYMTLESTMIASIGGEAAVPKRGEIVRMIYSKGAFGQWIDAKNLFDAQNKDLGRGMTVGDIHTLDSTHAIRYQSTGGHDDLETFTDQAAIDDYLQNNAAYRSRAESLGWRGNLVMQPAPPEAAGFVVECETAYHEIERQGIQLEEPAGPFDGETAAPEAPAAAPAASSFFAGAST